MTKERTWAVSLPMYDFPYVKETTEVFWKHLAQGLSARIPDAPQVLHRPIDLWPHWQAPGLLFSQTCGYPFVHSLKESVAIVGTPDYGVVAQRPGYYQSFILCREHDPRAEIHEFSGATFAYNAPDSQSGFWSLCYFLLGRYGQTKFFHRGLLSGAHSRSIELVKAGKADLACVDAVSFAHIRASGGGGQMRVLAKTDPVPGLPYISSFSDVGFVRHCVEHAIEKLTQKQRDRLMLKGLWQSNFEDYKAIEEQALQARCIADQYF